MKHLLRPDVSAAADGTVHLDSDTLDETWAVNPDSTLKRATLMPQRALRHSMTAQVLKDRRAQSSRLIWRTTRAGGWPVRERPPAVATLSRGAGWSSVRERSLLGRDDAYLG